MRFLFQWQHLATGSRLHGEEGLRALIDQLGGFEAPAGAWERHILPMRMSKYDPDYLDRLCLGGSVMWARVSGSQAERPSLTNAALISIFPREYAEWLLRPRGRRPDLGPLAENVYQYLHTHGASFSPDIARRTEHSQSDVEEGLWQLTAAGLLTADGFENLRTLLNRGRRQNNTSSRKHVVKHAAGRWSLLPEHRSEVSTNAEPIARQLLKRYGIVFRELLKREGPDLAWRDLLVHFRRMELKGEIRGGRFVDGFVGEQFALADAVESVRMARKSAAPQEVKIAAADPLNLVGIILPGQRVPSTSTNFLTFRDGVVMSDFVSASTT
jgi:ATP-dependent Lhr-like helicase